MNGKEVIVAAPVVTVNVGDVAPRNGKVDKLNHLDSFLA